MAVFILCRLFLDRELSADDVLSSEFVESDERLKAAEGRKEKCEKS